MYLFDDFKETLITSALVDFARTGVTWLQKKQFLHILKM